MMINVLRRAWRYFFDSWRFVEGAGRWSADPIQLDLIDAVLATLPIGIAATVRQQLEQRYFFSWMSDGRINVFFFYDERGLPLIDDSSFDDRLFKVDLLVDGRRHKAQVGFYKGRIHRVELKKPRSFFKDKSYRVGEVADGKPTDSFTRVIDRADHGKETDFNP